MVQTPWKTIIDESGSGKKREKVNNEEGGEEKEKNDHLEASRVQRSAYSK